MTSKMILMKRSSATCSRLYLQVPDERVLAVGVRDVTAARFGRLPLILPPQALPASDSHLKRKTRRSHYDQTNTFSFIPYTLVINKIKRRFSEIYPEFSILNKESRYCLTNLEVLLDSLLDDISSVRSTKSLLPTTQQTKNWKILHNKHTLHVFNFSLLNINTCYTFLDTTVPLYFLTLGNILTISSGIRMAISLRSSLMLSGSVLDFTGELLY